ncbi:MAG: argininosuccinate lyase [bacterium]
MMTKKNGNQQLWGGNFSVSPAAKVIAFCASRDIATMPPADSELLPFSVVGNSAHVLMLAKQKIISASDVKSLLLGLQKIEVQLHSESFVFMPEREDAQTNIEMALIDELGIEVGGKLHTARSRNDQVVLDTRLFLREKALVFSTELIGLLEVLVKLTDQYKNTVMPGFTHYQPAMVTTFGHMLGSFAVAVVRDLKKLQAWFDLYNVSPLGGAASYGTSFPLDRKYVADLLGFSGVEPSSLDPVLHRGEPEKDLVHCIESFLLHAANISHTLILFSTKQFNYIVLHDAYCTGSSIMPQKKNPDVLELIKGKAGYVAGQALAIGSIVKDSFLGLNRDTQMTKYAVMDVLWQSSDVATLLGEVLSTLTVNDTVMLADSQRYFLTSTDVVEGLVQRGLAFRQAKKLVELAVKYAMEAGEEKISSTSFQKARKQAGVAVALSDNELVDLQNPENVLLRRVSVGGPSPEVVTQSMIPFLQRELELGTAWRKQVQLSLQKAEQSRLAAISLVVK